MVTMTRNFRTLRKLSSAAFAQRKSRLELGHVLFIEIAGYSKRTTEEESEALPELNRIVRDTEAVRRVSIGLINAKRSVARSSCADIR